MANQPPSSSMKFGQRPIAAGRFGTRATPVPRGRVGGRPSPSQQQKAMRALLQARRGRQAPAPSGLAKLGGLLPGRSGASAKTASASKRPGKGAMGGVALLTGAAGFALSNREAITSLFKQRRSQQPEPEVVETVTVAPSENTDTTPRVIDSRPSDG